MSALVVGLGNRDRGDDAVGPVVASRCAAAGVRVVELQDPVRLLEEWDGAELVVVVDAVRSGRPGGELQVLELDRLPAADLTAAGGTHALGLAAVVELARVLDRLPPRLVVVVVEAVGFGFGEPLSAPVAAAVEPAAAVVRATLTAAGPLRPPDVRVDLSG